MEKNNRHHASIRSFKLDRQSKSFTLTLTPREEQVVELIVQGYLNKQIAQYFQVKEQTIKNCLSDIFKKLGVRNRTELAITAIKFTNLL